MRTGLKLTRPSPWLVYHCNYEVSRIQERPRPGALRRDHCQQGMVRTAADRPPPSIIAILQVNSASDWLVLHCGDSIRGTLTLTVFLPCGKVF